MTTEEAITAFLDAVSAVWQASNDPAVPAKEFEDLVAEREVLRRELRGRMLGVKVA